MADLSDVEAKEIRSEERVPIDVEIRFRYPEVFRGRMKDFCASGLGAEVPVSVDIDSPVEVEIFEGRLLASGHVRWLKMDEGIVRVGIQFREGDRDIIQQVREWKGRIV
jgi:PilZ domain